jgi:hypothetical protein
MRVPNLFSCVALLTATVALPVMGQLAVTEVHSAASVATAPFVHADWWELTNYGAESVDLTGWLFNDTTGGTTTGVVTLPSMVIAPGESVIFAEGLDDAAFRTWWGAAVAAGVQVNSYAASGIGLSSSGDGIRLWRPGAAADAIPVVSVDFGAAGTNTATFVPDSVTGLLTGRSVAGAGGAALAADGLDAGSPGVSPAAIPLSVLSLSTNQVVDPGATVTLQVQAAGFPRPAYQWFKGDSLVENATSASLTLTNFTASMTGEYSVRLDNGLGNLRSAVVRLSLAAAPAAPAFTTVLTNTTVFAGATVELAVVATGVPQPSFAWYFGTQPIPSAVGPVLSLAGVTTNQSGSYTVVASNASGAVTNSAVLTVLGRPDIRFTEVSSARTILDPGFIDRNGFGAEDWWELTSFSPVPISLTGWRVDDNSANLGVAITITNANLVIQPGESIVFVERLTPDQFRTWWGTNELPAGLKIISYTGSGIGLSSAGDGLRLWNAVATANGDTIAAVDFPAGEPGVSFSYDPDTGVFGALSIDGVNGVYQAPGTLVGVTELGSPGRIRAGTVVLPPTPPVLSVERIDGSVRISFAAQGGRTYRLQRRQESDGAWVGQGAALQPSADGRAEFLVEVSAGSPVGLFRVTAE